LQQLLEIEYLESSIEHKSQPERVSPGSPLEVASQVIKSVCFTALRA
jgi:hypothetical protein